LEKKEILRTWEILLLQRCEVQNKVNCAENIAMASIIPIILANKGLHC